MRREPFANFDGSKLLVDGALWRCANNINAEPFQLFCELGRELRITTPVGGDDDVGGRGVADRLERTQRLRFQACRVEEEPFCGVVDDEIEDAVDVEEDEWCGVG